MEKKKTRSAPKRADTPRGALHALVVIFTVLVMGLLVLAAPAVIVLLVGMVPTAVAIFIDRDPQKYSSISVAAMNFAGVSPYLVEFLLGTASFSRAIELVSDVFVLVIIYGAAAAGWLLILALPPLAAIILTVMTESRIQALRKDQGQLVEEWGENVAGG